LRYSTASASLSTSKFCGALVKDLLLVVKHLVQVESLESLLHVLQFGLLQHISIVLEAVEVYRLGPFRVIHKLFEFFHKSSSFDFKFHDIHCFDFHFITEKQLLNIYLSYELFECFGSFFYRSVFTPPFVISITLTDLLLSV